jgi:hypothetical protein
MSARDRRDPGPEPSAAAQARQHPAVFGAHSIRTLGLGFKSCGPTMMVDGYPGNEAVSLLASAPRPAAGPGARPWPPGLTTTMDHGQAITAPTPTFHPYRSPARWRGRTAKINDCGTLMILLNTVSHSWNRGEPGTMRVGRGGRVGMQWQAPARFGWGTDGPGTSCATALIQRQRSTIMRWRGSESGRHPCRGPAALRSGQAVDARGQAVDARGQAVDARGQAVASARSSVKPRVLLGSTGMPGPIVVVNVTFFRYRPLAAAGLSLITSSRAAA